MEGHFAILAVTVIIILLIFFWNIESLGDFINKLRNKR